MLPADANLRSQAAQQRRAAKRREVVLGMRIAGLTKDEIAKACGISLRTVYNDLAATEDSRLVAEELIEDAGLDAQDAWVTLSRMHDADIADLFDEKGEIKHPTQWPLIWRQGLAGEITVEDVSERSADGVQAGESKAWDKVGTRVKIKRESLLKILELTLRLKTVDGIAQQKQGDVNVLVVAAEKARQVVNAKKRLARSTSGSGVLPDNGAIDIKSNPVNES